MICFGHRGAMGHVTENTLESFELAIKQGVNAIELDIMAVDGKAFVFHDYYLKRLCNIEKKITDLSVSEISNLKVEGKYKIPLLEEVFDIAKNKVGLNIELKNIEAARVVCECLKSHNYNLEQILISSFDHHQLSFAKTQLPNVKIGALQISIPVSYSYFAKELNAYSIHLASDVISREYVENAHNNGLKVFVFTVNSESEMKYMKLLNVDGIFTNYPDIFFKQFEKVNLIF